MTLLEYINKHNNKDLDIDAIIGDVDPCATISWDNDEYHFTPYCMKKYGDILNAKIKIIKEEYHSDYNYLYSTIEVVGDIDHEHGAKFLMDLAGYTTIEEYEKLFGKKGDLCNW